MSLERPERSDVEIVTDRLTVVTALPLKRAARDRLAELLNARVVDIRDLVEDVDLVLTPAGSPQLIGMLRQRYGAARIIVVELDDWDFDISLPGPVKRILGGGADAYVLADNLEELAQKITPQAKHSRVDSAAVEVPELPPPATTDELVAALLRESIMQSTRLSATSDHSATECVERGRIDQTK